MDQAVIRRRRNGGFNPSRLFAASEQGQLSEVNPAYLFQDTAGTTPVTTPGQAAAQWMDRSGRGNHDTQATVGSRPIYGKHPANGYRNMLASSEDFSAAVWQKTPGSITATAVTAPDGTASAATFTATTDTAYLFENVNVGPIPQTPSVYVRRRSGTGNIALRVGSTDTPITGITGEWTRIAAPQAAPGGNGFVLSLGANSSIDVWHPQLELGSTATPYQRTGASSGVAWPAPPSYDITEAGQADLHYLHYNGVSSFMVSPTITPNIDKAQVFIGVRKLSDAATGMIVESSTTASAGGVSLYVPSSLGGYQFISTGSVGVSPSASGYPAPIINVVSALGDISGDNATLRINGTQVAQSTADQGTGNYLAYPLYTGRRGGTSLPFNGLVYCKIVRFGANLTADQIAATERWTAQRTGVAI